MIINCVLPFYLAMQLGSICTGRGDHEPACFSLSITVARPDHGVAQLRMACDMRESIAAVEDFQCKAKSIIIKIENGVSPI